MTPPARIARHARSVGLSNVGKAARVVLTLDFPDFDGIAYELPRFAPDVDNLAVVVDRARQLVAGRKVYVDPASGAVSLNADGQLDLAGMLASEGLGTITKGA